MNAEILKTLTSHLCAALLVIVISAGGATAQAYTGRGGMVRRGQRNVQHERELRTVRVAPRGCGTARVGLATRSREMHAMRTVRNTLRARRVGRKMLPHA